METDDLLAELENICRIGAAPGGKQILEALYPGTVQAVIKAGWSDSKPVFTHDDTPSDDEQQESAEFNRREP